MYKLFFTVFLAFVAAAPANDKCGVYLTEKDFQDGKFSATGNRMSSSTSFGKETLKLWNGKQSTLVTSKTCWGFRINNTDYRFIDDVAHAIATRGDIWMYSGSNDGIYISNDTVMYKKSGNSYPKASKGYNGELKTIKNLKDLAALMDGMTYTDIQQLIKEGKVTSYLEDVANYYNSTKPGFQGKNFTHIEYWLRN